MTKIFFKTFDLFVHARLNLFLSAFCILLLIINFFSLTNQSIAIVWLAFQIGLLTFWGCKRRVGDFLLVMTILGVFSFEFNVFYFENSANEAIYSIFNVPILGGKLFFFGLLFQFIFIIKKDPKFVWLRKLCLKFPNLKSILFFCLFCQISGILSGLMFFLSNSIGKTDWLFNNFLKDFFLLGSFNLTLFCFIYAAVEEKCFLDRLRQLLLAILSGTFFVSLLFYFSGNFVEFGGSNILPLPLSCIFVSFSFLFLLYPSFVRNHFFKFLAISSIISSFFLSTSGKAWLIMMFLPFFIFFITLRQRRYLLTLSFSLPVFIAIFTVLVFGQVFLEGHAKTKFEEALILVSFVSYKDAEIENWYELLPLSPKIRIEEFFNIALDYSEMPVFALMGKGFGGGVKDIRGTFGSFIETAFSDDQYINNLFISMHSSIVTIFLKFGILGLMLFLAVIFSCLRNVHKSPWLASGLIWVAFFYGYSFSVAFLGIPSLILGLCESSVERPNDLKSIDLIFTKANC